AGQPGARPAGAGLPPGAVRALDRGGGVRVNVETILNAAIGVLKQRGRCVGDYETGDGRVDQLGALAIAGGETADIWRFWREFAVQELDGHALVLVEAARALARQEAPLQPVDEMSVEQLVTLLGDANDVLSDAGVFTFLARAAEAARAVSVRDYQTGDAA